MIKIFKVEYVRHDGIKDYINVSDCILRGSLPYDWFNYYRFLKMCRNSPLEEHSDSLEIYAKKLSIDPEYLSSLFGISGINY